MRRRRRSASAGAALLCAIGVGLVAPAASADSATSKKADKLFKEGAEDLRLKRYGEACPKLEESNHLERAVGTEYNLAVCYELSRRFASARRVYAKVVSFATQSGKLTTANDASERTKALDKIVPRLVLKTARQPPSLRVWCDDEEIPASSLAKPVELDPGVHQVWATADGFKKIELSVTLAEGETKEIPLELEPSTGGAPKAETTPPDRSERTTESGGIPWRWIGLGTAAAGVVGVGVGLAFGASAKSARDDSGCREARFCPDEASADKLRGAKSDAEASTAFVLIGGVLVAAGATMYFLAPSRSGASVAVSVATSPHATGLRLDGRF